jgi:hypothetical protein
MKFPNNLEAPAQAFATAIKRYSETAQQKISYARQEAVSEAAKNGARKNSGQANIMMSGRLFFGFLAVMFLYLLVALERHHRTVMKFVTRSE